MTGDAVSRDMRHLGILVGALDQAMSFYGDVLGFKETWRGSRDGKELSWVNLQVPDGDDYLKFMLYRDLPEPAKRGSQHHIALFVTDIAKAEATLRARAGNAGYTQTMEVRTGINRKRQLNLYDPDGTRCELMEPDPVDGKPGPSSTAPPPKKSRQETTGLIVREPASDRCARTLSNIGSSRYMPRIAPPDPANLALAPQRRAISIWSICHGGSW